MNKDISILAINQRIRNRIMEYLELVSSSSDLEEYQSKAPVCILNELIQQWNDWVELDGNSVYELFPHTPYTSNEQVAISEFNKIWDRITDNIPEDVTDIYGFIKTEEFKELSLEAKRVFDIFNKRGFLNETK